MATHSRLAIKEANHISKKIKIAGVGELVFMLT